MRPWLTILLGIALVLAGTLFALLELGVLLIADCSEACQARGEQLVVGLLMAAGIALAGVGVWLVRRGALAARRA